MIPVVFVGGFGLGATLAIVAAVVYGQQAAPTTDVLADVTERLRHPVRWTLRNPLRALQRVWIF